MGGNSPLGLQAGASLESLAKGAVQFSQRFTVRELQDRWHSLLYDPVLSGEASARMIEFERSTLTLPSKFNRFGNSKENRSARGKRKAETIRSCYYALRKRICNEPFNSMDLSFLVAPIDSDFVGNGDEPLSANYMLEDPISDHFGTRETNLDIINRVFPQMVTDNAATTGVGTSGHGFHEVVQNSGEGDLPLEQSIRKQIPQILEESLPHTGHCSGIELIDSDLACNLFEADGLEAKRSSTFDLIDGDLGTVCSDFGGDQAFSLPGSDCGTSFDNLGYSSPLPGMPIWDSVEGIAVPVIPVDASPRKKDQHTEDTLSLPVDGHASAPGYDVAPLGPELKETMPCDQLNNSSPDVYLAELSPSLLDFPNDILLMDADGKDIEKSYMEGLNSLLLSSPTDDSNHDPVPDMAEPETSAGPDTYLMIPQGACPGELDNKGSMHCGDVHSDCNPEAPMLSSTVDLNPQFPEMCNGVICCVLNTEDLDIPCNDDVFLLSHEANNSTSSSAKDFTDNQKSSGGCSNMLKSELKFRAASQIIRSQASTKIGLNRPVGGCDIKFEMSESDSMHMASRSGGLVCGSSSLNPTNVKAHPPLPKMLKEEASEIKPARNVGYNSLDSFMEKPGRGSDSFKSYPQANSCGVKQEVDAMSTAQNHQALDFAVLNPVVNPSSSDQEEQYIESDDDIPYVSDIEAMVCVKCQSSHLIGYFMPPFWICLSLLFLLPRLFNLILCFHVFLQILDMDLDPDDQEYDCGEGKSWICYNSCNDLLFGMHLFLQ